MKKLLIIILLLFTHVFYAQVSDVKTVRIANATATFAENIPAGTQVYNVATGELWVANTAVISTLTLTTGSASFDLVGATPDGYTINDGTSSGGNFDVQISGTSGTYPTILQLDQTAAFGGQVTLGVGGALMKMYANPETITFEGSGGIVTEGRIAINNGSFNGQIFSTNLTATRNYELPNAAGVFAIEADASGFDGNLTNTDNTLQEIAQKFDDIVIPIDTNLAIATTGEIDTGTVDNKAMSPLGFAGSQYAIDITVNNAKVSATTATKYIYVSSYSIDDTGATSSSQAIQDALDAATGADNVVVFPSTATLLAKNLTIKPNTKIIADGTVFNFGGSSPSGYSANSDNSQQGIFHAYGTNISTMLTNIEIQGGEYNGERGATDWSTYAERDAFQFMYVDGLKIHDVTIKNFEQDGIEIKSCYNVLIENNRIEDIVDAAIEFRAGKNVIIQNNVAVRVRNLVMYKEHDVLGAGTTVYSNEGTKILNNYGETFSNGLLFNWFNNSTIDGNYIKQIAVTGEDGTAETGIVIEPHPVTPEPSSMENIILSNNTVEGVTSNSAIRVKNLNSTNTNVRVLNNIVKTVSSGKGIDFLSAGEISGNYIPTGTTNGIEITSQGDIFVNKNNANKITVLSASQANTLTFNGNTLVSSFSLESTNTKYILKNNISGTISTQSANAVVESNTITSSTNRGIILSGNFSRAINNEITITGAYNAIRVTSDYNVVSNNTINVTTGALNAIDVIAGSDYNVFEKNDITSSTTGSGIYVYSDFNNLKNNTINGGNQGIRVSGDKNYLESNVIVAATYNGIHLVSGATNNTLNSNKIISATTNINDEGTTTTQLIDTENAVAINGVKTFNTSPIVPTPTTDYQSSTKKYVDDNITTATESFNNNIANSNLNANHYAKRVLNNGGVFESIDQLFFDLNNVTTESIQFTPNAVQADTLYGIDTSDYLTGGDGDFTYARTDTATRINVNGLVETVAEDVPRIDYSKNPSGEFLREPASTNLLLRSEDFSNGSWSKSNGLTVTADAIIAPDGTLTADKLTFSTTANSRVEQSKSVTAATEYTLSCWAKSLTGDQTRRLGTSGGVVGEYADVVITSEWQRFEVTITSSSTTEYPLWSNNNDSSEGEIYVWGMQFEQKEAATSYIPTTSTTVTRNAETVEGAGSTATINSEEGVLYMEVTALADDSTERYISVSDGSTDDQAILGYDTASNYITAEYFVGGVSTASLIYEATDITVSNKIAFSYADSDFKLYLNGVEVDSKASGSVAAADTFMELQLAEGDGTNPFIGRIRELKVFPTALSDTELAALTSKADYTPKHLARTDVDPYFTKNVTVQGIVTSAPKGVAVNSTTHTLSSTLNDYKIIYTSGSAKTVTIPTNATEPIPMYTSYDIINTGAGDLTFSTTGIVLTYSLVNATIAQNAKRTLTKIGENGWLLSY